MTTTKFFEVGGCVRDELLGLRSKDVDFTVVGPTSFEDMRAELVAMGFDVKTEKPEMVTVTAGVPESMPELRERSRVADFVLARKESSASDGRRPDVVEPGTLEDDLMRRDFTVNALARDPESGFVLDLFGGVADLDERVLRFVRTPMDRIREDALRVARGFRFMVTKGLRPESKTFMALTSPESADLLSATKADGKRVVSVDRLQSELDKMLKFDCAATMSLLASLPAHTRAALLPVGVDLVVTFRSTDHRVFETLATVRDATAVAKRRF